MDGILSAAEMRLRFKRTEYYSRWELAQAFTGGGKRVSSSQITRDIQALYGHDLDRKPIPYEVAIELYVARLFRMQAEAVNDAKQVRADQLLEFMQAFDRTDNPKQAKWAYAEQLGGGKQHFEQVIIGKIKRLRSHKLTGGCFDVAAMPA